MNKWQRGEIWLIRLDPSVGSEINKTRPAVIISRTDYNMAAETVTVIPISSGRFISGLHVAISALKKQSHAVVPQVRIASKQRLVKKIAAATPEEVEAIEDILRFYLDLI